MTGRLLVGGLIIGTLVTGGLFLSGCKEKEMPKPYAYARLEYPASSYLTFHLPGHPCRFEYPGFFTVNEKPSGKADTRWVDLRWPAYGVTVFTTYQRIKEASSAEELAVRMEMLLAKKLPEHSTVNTRLVSLPDTALKAFVFEVDGPASVPLEFMIADDKQNLFQGIVQFDQALNRDSLADILQGLTSDMHRLIASFTFTSTP